ncbi:MAG: response regulator [Arthrospira sp. PLM2.Bin9]|nr:response regulator [Arthrospira sp. PLM2.Bin9]TVU53282.1 MAG: response regulator [Arthrospira sp. PLM2.Bin9]
MKILLVDDDQSLNQQLSQSLKSHNYVVDMATDGESGWNYIESFEYSLIILDIMLPKLNGIALCRKLRSHNYQMPVLLLTARDSCEDKVLGLDAGADDYLVKPIMAEELIARIRALLRRPTIALPPVIRWGDLTLNPAKSEILYKKSALDLTPKEYGLMELFIRSPSRVFSYDAIIEHLWCIEEPAADNTVRAHIKSLRNKLKAADANPQLIENVYGMGYRLKSADNQSIQHKYSLSKPPSSVEETVNEIWAKIRDKTIAKVESIQDIAKANLPNLNADNERRKDAYVEAHKLAGSLGTFGYSRGSKIARKIEFLLGLEEPLTTDKQRQIEQLTQDLLKEITQQPNQPKINLIKDLPNDSLPSLLIVDNDTILGEKIIREAHSRGLEARLAPSVGIARAMMMDYQPSLILLELNFPKGEEDGIMLLEDIAYHHPQIPVVIFSKRSSFIDRLTVCRLGSRAFLQKPMSSHQIMEIVTGILNHHNITGKIIVIDDDPQILELLEALLSPLGLQVKTLNSPRKFWQLLESSNPDLLIIDVEMPHYNGIDLCQVIRNEPRWRYLPILILTNHTDPETRAELFRAGADDFISKPVVGPELIARLFSRLHRSRLWRSIAEIDTLTGVENRYKSTEDINRLIRLASRHKQPLCFAILDLDNFKDINDQYGHETGDWVLHQFGEVLTKAFRQEDIVGRWGGEEFAVAMYGTSKQDAMNRLQKVLEEWRLEVLAPEDNIAFSVTFSGGVAQYPEDGEDLQLLYRTADATLYKAKKAGRNQIMG